MPGKTEAPHELPFVKQEDKPPSAEEATKPLAERVHERLDAIDLSQLVAAEEDDGKLVIVKDGAAAYKAMSGDVTISEDGVASIGKEKVGSEELGKKAVGTDKLNDGAVTEGKTVDGAMTSRKTNLTADVISASEDLSLTTSYQDVPGAVLVITPAVTSKLLVTVFFDFEAFNETDFKHIRDLGTCRLDAADQAPVARLDFDPVSGAVDLRATVGQVYALSLTAASHTIKLRAKMEVSGGGSATCYAANTRFLYELIAS